MKCFPYLLRTHRSAPDLKLQADSFNSSTDQTANKNNPSSSSASSRSTIPELYEARASNLRVFTFAELRTASNGFSRVFKIGEGGFGGVYKGLIKPANSHGDRIVVAIKKLNNDGFQGHKEWISEVQFLGVVDHPNLVKLIGYCAVDEEAAIERLLVYEFMPNQSLEEHLFNSSHPTLPWHSRLHILLGAAQGLAYLHEQLQIQVIYRDFKASNVLLDKDFKPKLSDFGLAREGPAPGHTHVSTEVMGTQGYAAPDYLETGHLTTKSDVWSFGVVLYEILTGRRCFSKDLPKKERKLLDWVRRFPPRCKRFSEVIDPRLVSDYSLSSAREIAVLAEICLSKSAKERPKMSEVAERLKTIISDCDLPNIEIGSAVDCESSEDERGDEADEASESEKRRITHLAKLGQRVEGISRKGFMLMQRAKISN